jgi:hypothetical protein
MLEAVVVVAAAVVVVVVMVVVVVLGLTVGPGDGIVASDGLVVLFAADVVWPSDVVPSLWVVIVVSPPVPPSVVTLPVCAVAAFADVGEGYGCCQSQSQFYLLQIFHGEEICLLTRTLKIIKN